MSVPIVIFLLLLVAKCHSVCFACVFLVVTCLPLTRTAFGAFLGDKTCCCTDTRWCFPKQFVQNPCQHQFISAGKRCRPCPRPPLVRVLLPPKRRLKNPPPPPRSGPRYPSPPSPAHPDSPALRRPAGPAHIDGGPCVAGAPHRPMDVDTDAHVPQDPEAPSRSRANAGGEDGSAAGLGRCSAAEAGDAGPPVAMAGGEDCVMVGR